MFYTNYLLFDTIYDPDCVINWVNKLEDDLADY